jgi:septum site-determining protein MinC
VAGAAAQTIAHDRDARAAGQSGTKFDGDRRSSRIDPEAMMDVLPTDRPDTDSSVSSVTRNHAAFDLKGVMSSMTVLRLRSRDLNLIERQLRAKVTQFPQFFQDAPVVLDLAELEGGLAGFPLAALVRALSVCRVVPVAVANIDDSYRAAALAAGLGIVSLSAARGIAEAPGAPAPAARAPAPAPAAPPADSTPAPVPPPPAPPVTARGVPIPQPPPPSASPGGPRVPMVISEPVRSGQLIYAERCDLIVLAPVNPGAQLVADGNIHVYAPLRGRAVAGARGFAEARIFCQKLEAELIAISGAYVTFDDIPADRLGKGAQVFVRNGECVILPL